MLHAITQNKTRFYRRYLGHREPTERTVREEDEITSLIMSPLSLLPPQAIGVFWQRLVSADHGPNLPAGPVTKARMNFWPKRGIEPDMLVELEWANGEFFWLLIEFKWHAPLSKNQLQKQWCNFLSWKERESTYHLFIACELNTAINAQNTKDVWKDGMLLLRSWMLILQILEDLKDDPEAQMLLPWAEQVKMFLGKLNVSPFIGFNKLKRHTTIPLFQNSWLFWNRFTGFAHLVPPKRVDNSTFFSPCF